MKKKFKAKVSGMFDIVQLGDDTFSEVVEKLKANDYHIDQQFTSREECYIEAIGDSVTKSVSRGDMVFTDETGELFIMSEKRFNATYEEVEEETEWKDVSIKPPFNLTYDGNKYSDSVLCKDEWGNHYVAQYVRWRTGWWGWIDADENEVNVTHWKELPQSQKGE